MKILCPVDFSASSGAALELALRLARETAASVTLAHVVQTIYMAAPDASFALGRVYDEQAESAEKELVVWKAKGSALAPGIAIETLRLIGTPWDSLSRHAKEGSYDLIVMGTQGRTGLAHALIGSVAERLVRHAPCSVLVARQPVAEGPLFRSILCPVDFSEPSRVALRNAADLAKRTGAALTVLHVYARRPPMTDREAEDDISRMRPRLTEWAAEARALGAPAVEIAWEEGREWQAIVRRAAELHHDLVVVGTHGRTGLRHVFLGSTAERVLRHAPCPVLIARDLHG